jgi:hypothetical protein
MPPDARAFQAGTNIRCVDGGLLACFTGANLPCVKMNIARDNEGADAFCRSNPDAPAVPAFASGHDSIYAYRCSGRRAEVESTIFPLDARGSRPRFGLGSSSSARLIRSGRLQCGKLQSRILVVGANAGIAVFHAILMRLTYETRKPLIS